MFTEQQLQEAHLNVKSGADFPKYIHDIKGLGLLRYEYYVTDGTIINYGQNDYQITSGPKYLVIQIATEAFVANLKHSIAIHQQGQTTLETFCQQVANAGVEKWVIDTEKMLCTYYDLKGNAMVAESIPQA